MRATLGAIGLALGLVSTAGAADLGVPARAPMAAPAGYNWTGFYIGAHGGYGLGKASSDILGGEVEPSGGSGGGQVGYNWQIGSWVFGVEADAAWASIEDSFSATVPPVTVALTDEIKGFGTLRGRLGIAAGSWLFYGTGGLAWASNEGTASATAGGITAVASETKTHLGWAAGAGIEWGFAPNWTAKAEYLYLDLGSEDYLSATLGVPIDIDLTVHSAKVGINYRFGGP